MLGKKKEEPEEEIKLGMTKRKKNALKIVDSYACKEKEEPEEEIIVFLT